MKISTKLAIVFMFLLLYKNCSELKIVFWNKQKWRIPSGNIVSDDVDKCHLSS